MNVPKNSPPPGQVMAPAAAIGTLALVLATGLGLLGFLARADGVIAGWLDRRGADAFPNRSPEWMVWVFAALMAYGLSLAMLSVPALWRRVVLWISALIVTAAWAPVMALAAMEPAASAGIVAILWSGLCSLIYTRRHRMECDQFPTNLSADGPR